MKWLYRVVSLLYGCRHKWTILQAVKIFETDGARLPCETKLLMKCTKCGDVKTKKVS